MNIIIKEIGKREYAYLALREGKKVIHKYLGSVRDPKVIKMIAEREESAAVSQTLRPLFWDTTLKRLHLKKHARYIIERVLEFGDMSAFRWLQRVYPVQTILDVLNASRTITEKSRNFWMTWILN
ncbi:MAG: hypothetical protein HY755_06815 [Nitrospirae bacterium]|nr:hypothetical protein [Nitrospirota bacterium]